MLFVIIIKLVISCRKHIDGDICDTSSDCLNNCCCSFYKFEEDIPQFKKCAQEFFCKTEHGIC